MGYLRTMLQGTLTDDELELLPRGFEHVGHVAIISLPPELVHKTQQIAEALLKNDGVKTVALR